MTKTRKFLFQDIVYTPPGEPEQIRRADDVTLDLPAWKGTRQFLIAELNRQGVRVGGLSYSARYVGPPGL